MGHWGKRLESYLLKKIPGENVSWNARAERLGVSGQNLSNWRNCRVAEVPGELVSKLIEAFPEFDVNYLYRESWPAEFSEKDRPATNNGQRAEDFPILNTKDSLIEPGDMPNPSIRPGFAFGVGEHDQLFIDFIVSGPGQRGRISILRERDP